MRFMDKRKAWDKGEEVNIFHYVDTLKEDWDETDFWKSGKENINQHVLPFLKNQNFDPTNKIALDIGCGVGRLTRALAGYFREAHGIDSQKLWLQRVKN